MQSLTVAGSDELLLANNPGTRRSQLEFPAQPVTPGLSKGISDNLPGVHGCVPQQCWRERIQQLAESGSVVPNFPREESSLLKSKHSEPAKSPPAKSATRENWKVSCSIFNNAAPIQICEQPSLQNPIPNTQYPKTKTQTQNPEPRTYSSPSPESDPPLPTDRHREVAPRRRLRQRPPWRRR